MAIGDFRSSECIEILKSSDVIITNPPFSLFREFVLTIMEHQKQFLVLGNLSTIICRGIFPLIRDNKAWLGHNHSNMWFKIPENYPLTASQHKTDKEGNRYIPFASVRWLTNIDTRDKSVFIPLEKEYSPREHRTFINYDAINVNKVADIPKDYFGKMGVPLTFLDKYNPEQFEIVSVCISDYIQFTNNKKLIDLRGTNKGNIIYNAYRQSLPSL